MTIIEQDFEKVARAIQYERADAALARIRAAYEDAVGDEKAQYEATKALRAENERLTEYTADLKRAYQQAEVENERLREACDRLARWRDDARAENEALRAERGGARFSAQEAVRERDALRDENKRLRELLADDAFWSFAHADWEQGRPPYNTTTWTTTWTTPAPEGEET